MSRSPGPDFIGCLNNGFTKFSKPSEGPVPAERLPGAGFHWFLRKFQ